jgi:hypothetical protein
MCKSASCESYYESHVELAVAVFKTQNQKLVISLKNFLTLLPSPQCLEEVLKSAVCQAAVTDSETCRWILSHASSMEPELDLRHFLMESVTAQFQDWGFVFNQDFWFDRDNRLHLNVRGKMRILAEELSDSTSLLEEIFIYGQKHK